MTHHRKRQWLVFNNEYGRGWGLPTEFVIGNSCIVAHRETEPTPKIATVKRHYMD